MKTDKTKIVVAGGGHGGLAAAALLARKGFDVTVFEAQAEEAMGYDWCDCIRMSCFDRTGLERPNDEWLTPMKAISYYNPRKSVCIRTGTQDSSVSFVIERKLLLRHLIALARGSGAKLCFSRRVLSAVTQGDRVVGVLTETGEVRADIVIDAAGMDSPVRRSLPAGCGIQREIDASDTLFTYRALFVDTGTASDMPAYSAYFCHLGVEGFDWVIRETDHVDVLIGAFGGLSEEMIRNAVDDFKRDHPYIGDQILRGGSCSRIPVRRTLPKFVCDGYAAIGDSAAMIEPLSGSGMTLSIRSAGFLADAIEQAQDCSTASLWSYESAYFRSNLSLILRQQTLKDVMHCLGARNIDTLFEKQMVTVKDFTSGKQTSSDLLHKVTGAVSAPSMLPVFAEMLLRSRKQKKLLRTLPQDYSYAHVLRWIDDYDRF